MQVQMSIRSRNNGQPECRSSLLKRAKPENAMAVIAEVLEILGD